MPVPRTSIYYSDDRRYDVSATPYTYRLCPDSADHTQQVMTPILDDISAHPTQVGIQMLAVIPLRKSSGHSSYRASASQYHPRMAREAILVTPVLFLTELNSSFTDHAGTRSGSGS
jgi:hypothetical protein